MLPYPNNYFFTRDHEWINLDNNIATIGLMEFALREIGDIKKLDLDTPGGSYDRDQVYGRIYTDKYLTKLIMPFQAKLSEANTRLLTSENSINEQFLHDNWLIKVTTKQPLDISHLLSWEDYKTFRSANLLHMTKYLTDLKTPQKG